MVFLNQRLEELRDREDKLLLRAPYDGVWVSDNLHERVNSIVSRGDALGQVSQPHEQRFIVVVTQEQVANLFREEFESGTIRFRSQALADLAVDQLQFIPLQRQLLPSPALGWDGGGPIMSRANADGTIQSIEPFFEVHVSLPPDFVQFEGQTGVLKIALNWQPLYWQAKQFTLQLLQQRFKQG
jgi:putative peptide zinc metalloprotease protein